MIGLIFLGCQSQRPAPLARIAVYLYTPLTELSKIEIVLLKVHSLILGLCSIHFISLPPRPLSNFRGVFICRAYLFFLHCRSSLDNSSDKSTAENVGKKRSSSLGESKLSGSRWILPLLSVFLNHDARK